MQKLFEFHLLLHLERRNEYYSITFVRFGSCPLLIFSHLKDAFIKTRSSTSFDSTWMKRLLKESYLQELKESKKIIHRSDFS
ncbi:unnamed protein product [Amoebophrya sp. A25]|nr:unnamed protein product [Amoebophrya sp. A25]|eukprot:GSA25T00003154001.1